MSSEWTTLAALAPGALFETADGVQAVKSEYRYNSGSQCECVLLASGEYAHFPDGDRTRVRVLDPFARLALVEAERRQAEARIGELRAGRSWARAWKELAREYREAAAQVWNMRRIIRARDRAYDRMSRDWYRAFARAEQAEAEVERLRAVAEAAKAETAAEDAMRVGEPETRMDVLQRVWAAQAARRAAVRALEA